MRIFVIYLITFVVAYCSITYELLLAQTLSTVLGNTVLRYSLTIGFYLAAMGVGAMLCNTKKNRDPVKSLVKVEIALIIIGGLSVILINVFDVFQKFLYDSSPFFSDIIFMNGSLAEIIFFILSQSVIIAIGIFSGFEVPLLIHLGEKEKSGTTNIVLGVDYFGSLAGSILFPLVLLPGLGIFSIAFFTGILNGIAALIIIVFKQARRSITHIIITVLLIVFLSIGLSNSDDIKQYYLKKFYYYDEVTTLSDVILPTSKDQPDIKAWESPYQHVELVESPDAPSTVEFYNYYSKKWAKDIYYPEDLWFFLNGSFQFFSLVDEIYHEYFVHVPVMMTKIPKRVCILGGGDGLVARELLKYSEVEEIYQVELDPKVIEIAKDPKLQLAYMNRKSFYNDRVKIVIQDAFYFLRHNKNKFDAIYIDFPTPMDYNLSMLYSVEFYTFVRYNLNYDGYAVMDMPDGELKDPNSYFRTYYSTVKSAGFTQVFPISTIISPFIAYRNDSAFYKNRLVIDAITSIDNDIMIESLKNIYNYCFNEDDIIRVIKGISQYGYNVVKQLSPLRRCYVTVLALQHYNRSYLDAIPELTEADIKALESFSPCDICDEVDAVDQQFLFMSRSNVPVNRMWVKHDIELNLLSKKRFGEVFRSFPNKIDAKLVNSIWKPTIPDFELFNINFPY